MDPVNPDDRVLDFCCRSKNGCPKITEINEGFVFEDEGRRVVLTREEAEITAKWLLERLSR
jgi:hypothetical protein